MPTTQKEATMSSHAVADATETLSFTQKTTEVAKGKRPFVVELVGLAGAGKSTVTRALLSKENDALRQFQLCHSLPLSTLQRIGHTLRLTKHFLPTYLGRGPRVDVGHSPQQKWFTSGEMRSLFYLSAWPAALLRQPHHNAIQLMDLGPIFRLVYLQEFGSDLTESQRFDSWYQHQIAEWRNLIDLIVLLDASDEVLQQRIDDREKDHVAKAQSLHQNTNFFQRYRTAYQRTITDICQGETQQAPQLLHYQTNEFTVDEIVTDLSQTLTTLMGNSPDNVVIQ